MVFHPFVSLSTALALLLIPLTSSPVYGLDYEAQIRLGAQLFFDPRLSGNNKLSCSTCHKPELAYTDGLTTAKGMDGRVLKRNTPSLLHVSEHSSFFWDGRSPTLRHQILEVLQNPDEMNQDLDRLVAELNGIPGYVDQFQEIYGTDVTIRGITRAIAAFEGTLVTKNTPFYLYLAGSKTAMNGQAFQGMELFQGKANCALCHNGFALTDDDFHNLGVPPQTDDGRYAITDRKTDRGSFKTPPLRNVTQTAPYMHNGVFKTLVEVIDFYDIGGGKNPNLDIQMKPLNLTSKEKENLIEFLKTLTGKLPEVEVPSLP